MYEINPDVLLQSGLLNGPRMVQGCWPASQFNIVLYAFGKFTYIFHSGLDVGMKVRPTDEELQVIGPDFTARWEEYFLPAPDKPVMMMAVAALFVLSAIGSRHINNELQISWAPLRITRREVLLHRLLFGLPVCPWSYPYNLRRRCPSSGRF